MGKLVAAAAVGLAGFGIAQQADASLIVDIRATTLNGLPVGADNKHVNANVGDVVGVQIVARVGGTNGQNDEAFQSITGSIFSNGGLLGNLGQNVNVSPFNGSGSQNGSQQDFDSDGDLDIGTIPNGARPATNSLYFGPRSAASTPDGTVVDSNTEDFLLANMTFTVTGGSGQTLLDFVRRTFPAGTADAATLSSNVDGGLQTGTSPYSTSPLQVGVVPEPTSAALAGLASLGLLARRRNKNA
jgi:hypothetical protein